jgi:hypothetical protein
MAKKNKQDKKITNSDSTAFTKEDWYGASKRNRKKKQKKQKQY